MSDEPVMSDPCPMLGGSEDLRLLLQRAVLQQPPPRRWMDAAPSVISGLTVIAAVLGMLWSFMLNQNVYQATNGQKLDQLTASLGEIRKNSDHVPLMQMQLNEIEGRQKANEDQERKAESKLSEVWEALVRMGVRTSPNPVR